jgi:hypothetical protein
VASYTGDHTESVPCRDCETLFAGAFAAYPICPTCHLAREAHGIALNDPEAGLPEGPVSTSAKWQGVEALALSNDTGTPEQNDYSSIYPLPGNHETFEKHSRRFWPDLDLDQVRFPSVGPPNGAARADMLISLAVRRKVCGGSVVLIGLQAPVPLSRKALPASTRNAGIGPPWTYDNSLCFVWFEGIVQPDDYEHLRMAGCLLRWYERYEQPKHRGPIRRPAWKVAAEMEAAAKRLLPDSNRSKLVRLTYDHMANEIGRGASTLRHDVAQHGLRDPVELVEDVLAERHACSKQR